MKSVTLTDAIEWLEPDGLGGFASGTASGLRTRRYQALLLTATSPPTGRFVLVNGFEAWIETDRGRFPLSAQRYAPDVVYPDGQTRLQSFLNEPWPTWRWRLESGAEITLELFVPNAMAACVLCWRLAKPAASTRLVVRPLLSGRDYHALHRENAAFRFEPTCQSDTVAWKPYDTVPATIALSNGRYAHDPEWFRNFLYVQERERGLDDLEDLASPGTFSWPLGDEAVLILAAEGHVERVKQFGTTATQIAQGLRDAECRRRASFSDRLNRSADAYIARRGAGKTIVAGYPWFTDWGRDTFIALRGLCLATGRFDEARDILTAWAGTISEGMLPNRFPDQGDAPEFNSVDASLWYIVAVHEYLTATDRAPAAGVAGGEKSAAAGCPRHLERILLRNALRHPWRRRRAACRGGRRDIADVDGRQGRRSRCHGTNRQAGRSGSLVAERGCASVRPSIPAGKAFSTAGWRRSRRGFGTRRAAACTTSSTSIIGKGRSTTPCGRIRSWPSADCLGCFWIRSGRGASSTSSNRGCGPRWACDRSNPVRRAIAARYLGSVRERDLAYHQGTVWPWLAGPFVEAWVRVRGSSPTICGLARSRFVEPLIGHLDVAGAGPHLRNRGRRFTARAARLSVSGLVPGRAHSHQGIGASSDPHTMPESPHVGGAWARVPFARSVAL
jgi:hypothetical protein